MADGRAHIARTAVVCYNEARGKLFTLGRSHSGLVRGTGNAVGDKTPRGFKSHPPRQFLLMCKAGAESLYGSKHCQRIAGLIGFWLLWKRWTPLLSFLMSLRDGIPRVRSSAP